MKIKSLKVQDFRCHKRLNLDFSEGVTAIIGPNESGKSSILEAIGFALYGSKAIRGKVGNLERRGGSGMNVTLEFNLGAEPYRVNRNAFSAVLHHGFARDGKLVADGIKSTDAAVAELVGMSWEEFAASAMGQQHELQRMVNMTPGKRGQFIRRIMGVDAVDKALASIRDKARQLEHRHRALADVDVKAAEGKVEAHQYTMLKRESEQASQRHAIEQAEAKVPEVRNTDALSEMAKLAEVVGRLETDLHRWKRKREECTMSLRRLARNIPEHPRSFEDLESRVMGLQAKEDARTHLIRRSRLEYEAARRNIASSHCELCERPFDEESAYAAKKVLERASDKLAEARKAPSGEALINEIIDELADRKKHAQLSSELPALTENVERAQRMLKDRRADLEALAADAEQARDAERRLGELVAMRAELEGTKAQLELIEEHLSESMLELDEARRKEGERDLHAAALADAKASVTVLEEFRAALLGRIRPELEELTSGLMNVLTDGRHEAVELDEDFRPVVYEDGKVSHVVSGGTMDCLGLAMRLALGQMLSAAGTAPCETLILDEPFGSLDGVRRQNVLNLLGRIKDIYPRVVLVSHVAETRDLADHLLNL